VAGVARSLGVRSLRLTGGEPLVRRGVVELVRQLATVGFEDVSLTTNGTVLAPIASELARAGWTGSTSAATLYGGAVRSDPPSR